MKDFRLPVASQSIKLTIYHTSPFGFSESATHASLNANRVFVASSCTWVLLLSSVDTLFKVFLLRPRLVLGCSSCRLWTPLSFQKVAFGISESHSLGLVLHLRFFLVGALSCPWICGRQSPYCGLVLPLDASLVICRHPCQSLLVEPSSCSWMLLLSSLHTLLISEEGCIRHL